MDDNQYDVVIVGAGISGIGNAYWLQKKCPGKKIVILEARKSIGGTWSLFQYPGIRSDSDMFTFGYRFKPWTNPQSLSSGQDILKYLQETVDENGLNDLILSDHRMTGANWSDSSRSWTLQVTTPEGEKQMQCKFLSICTGYYNYKEAHRPHFQGEERFRGRIVLPQFWPKDLDYRGKKVAVIGSGATAVTIVPNMADSGATHVTMVQRSPTYIMNLPDRNTLFVLGKKFLPVSWAYRATRGANILLQIFSFGLSRVFPNWMKKMLMKSAAEQLPEGYPVEQHFNPKYRPWDQRLCVAPDGDFFRVINEGKASVVTDTIAEFTPGGITTISGEEIPADIVVIATGLKIQLLGGASIKVNGNAVEMNKSMIYKGMMISDLPNLIYSFGYTNASWTLKVDLTANYLCRLLNHMDWNNYAVVRPVHPKHYSEEDFLNLSSGYIQRARDVLPKQGAKRPWRVYQSYLVDMLATRFGPVPDKVLKFETQEQ